MQIQENKDIIDIITVSENFRCTDVLKQKGKYGLIKKKNAYNKIQCPLLLFIYLFIFFFISTGKDIFKQQRGHKTKTLVMNCQIKI